MTSRVMIGSTSALNVQINGKLYPIESLLDKTVYAKRTTLLYPNTRDKATRQLSSGALIGKVYSWVTSSNGVFLMFMTGNSVEFNKYFPSGSYYVKVSDIDERTLKQQGAKDAETLEKEAREKEEQENLSTGDKIMKTATKVIMGLGLIWGITTYAKSR